MRIQGRIEDGQVIIAPSFGVRPGEFIDNPEDSNFKIVCRVQDIYAGREREKEIPVILQKEVTESRLKWMFRNGEAIIAVIKKHRTEGKYLDTYEVLAQSVEVMKENKWTKAILVAHPGQIWRAAKVLEKMGIEVIIPVGLEAICFDPYSTQWWTRGSLRWWIREIPARIFYKLKGYI